MLPGVDGGQVADLAIEVLCEYCLLHEEDTFFGCEVDHIISEKHGGATVVENLAYACAFCNLYKAAHVSGHDPESDVVVRLFHPREDQWEDHFQITPESGEIVGRTPIGRATVARLGINSAAQVAARQQWMRLGLFPSPEP